MDYALIANLKAHINYEKPFYTFFYDQHFFAEL